MVEDSILFASEGDLLEESAPVTVLVVLTAIDATVKILIWTEAQRLAMLHIVQKTAYSPKNYWY